MQKQTSCFRKIKSLKFLYEINENGTIIRNVKSKKQLKIKLDKHRSNKGYYRVWVHRNGKTQGIMIHKLVAECWLGDKPGGCEVDHIDRNPHNNHYSNLRYVTHSQQMKNRVLSSKIIEQAKQNCLKWTMEYVAKPVKLESNIESRVFPSISQASEYLASVYGVTKEHIRGKMKKRRSKIYDYKIAYFLECRD